MDTVALITFWQLAVVVLPIVAAVAGVSFLIWCTIGFVLWASGGGRGPADAGQPGTASDWLDSL